MNDLNSYEKVAEREKILLAQTREEELIRSGYLVDRMDACKLTHQFTARDERYGCHLYARTMFAPKGTRIFGKIHRYDHIAFIMQGKIAVYTEEGTQYYQAPCIFVAPAGVKRVGYVEEDVIWSTAHLVREADPTTVEEELIAPSYEEIGLLSSTKELEPPK